MSADEISDRVGLAADETIVRGARSSEAPSPKAHVWKVVCRGPGLRVDEQVDQVLNRLAPHVARLRALADLEQDGEPIVSCVLQIVRFMGDEAGDEGEEDDGGLLEDGTRRPAGQHQLLGWHLSEDQMRLLLDLKAPIDNDEYG